MTASLPQPLGITWTETFRGWLAFGQTDFNQSMLPQHREPVRARLSVEITDLDDYLGHQSDAGVSDRPAMAATVTDGSIDCDCFGGPLRVVRGTFVAFEPATMREPRDELHLRMRYDLELKGPAGDALRLQSFKLIENDPGYDSWSDTTTLFVRILDRDASVPVAIGVLRIGPLAFLHQLATFRGTAPTLSKRVRAVGRYQCSFAAGLVRAYAGPPVGDSRPSFPQDHVDPDWAQAPGPATGGFEPVPGTNLGRAVIPFAVPDLAFPLNLHRLRRLDRDGSQVPATKGPVLLVPGSGVRAEMYYGQPAGPSFAEYLLDRGYDVWVESWRASIDLPPNPYTLDQAAMIDHPAAVAAILDVSAAEGGEDRLKAVVHCQGSISFMMAAVAGWIDPRVTHIVSSAVSLFIDVTGSTWLKQRLAMPVVRRLFAGLDAQWGIRPVTPTAGLFAAAGKRMERPCGNPSCQVANFMYGSGWDVLFRHVGDDGGPWVADAVHEWAGRELGYTPVSLIAQVAESSRHGYIVPAASHPSGTPAGYFRDRPRTGAQVTFIAGDHNNMFRWQGQRRAKQYFDQSAEPGQADFVLVPGFGHLDTFWARQAPDVVFPAILDGLEWERGARPPSGSPGRPTSGGPLPPRRGRFLGR